MPTTREEHDIICIRCAEVIQPCPDEYCLCRYNHSEGLCSACADKEQGLDWKED